MFILPPPSRSAPKTELQTTVTAVNTFTKLTPASNQDFIAPEGTYHAKECLYVAIPPPHPSAPEPAIINPLAPTIFTPELHSSGVRMSWLKMKSRSGNGTSDGFSDRSGSVSTVGGMSNGDRKASVSTSMSGAGGLPPLRKTSTTSSSPFGKGLFNGRRPSTAVVSDDGSILDELESPNSTGFSFASKIPSTTSNGILEYEGMGLPPSSIGKYLGPLMQTIPSDVPKDSKRRKPKTSFSKNNNSSYVSKAVVADNLSKKLADQTSDDWFLWMNVGRSFNWIDMSPISALSGTRKDPLAKILFTKNHPLCHAVNHYTKATNNVDIVLGMSSGDAFWLDACSNRYTRINKNGDITRSAVTDIKWIPGSPNYFVTAHADGSLIIFDKDREDGRFAMSGALNHQDLRSTETFRIIKSLQGDFTNISNGGGNGGSGPGANGGGGSGNASGQHNPVAMYKLSNRPLTSITFSPDRQTLVVTSHDGFMRFLDLATEAVTDIVTSYYDGILCAAFSPDGLYLATGGQDDLVTLWNVKRKTTVARGYGHQSWVRKVAFDKWNCDEFSYRLGTAGDDGQLILWDFVPKALARPKAAGTRVDQTDHDPAPAPAPGKGGATVVHPFAPRAQVPTIPPVAVHLVKPQDATGTGESESLSDIEFMETEIVASARDGRVWTWVRPGGSQ